MIEINKYDKNLMGSMREALGKVAIRELPDVYDGTDIYTRAIALVKKQDGSMNYAIVRKNIKGEDEIWSDFGHLSVIKEILEVYPYEYLEESFMPIHDMDGEKKITRAVKVKAIMELIDGGELPKDEFDKSQIIKMKGEELNKILIGVACIRQREAQKIKKKVEANAEALKEKTQEEDKMIEEARKNLMEGVIPQEILDANEKKETENNNEDNEDNNGQGEE